MPKKVLDLRFRMWETEGTGAKTLQVSNENGSLPAHMLNDQEVKLLMKILEMNGVKCIDYRLTD